MSRNGSGSYSSPGASFPAVSGATIDSAKYNNVINDIGSALTQSIANDGQTVISANLPMSGFKHTGAAAATVAGQYIEYAQHVTDLALKANLAGAAFTGTLSATGAATLSSTLGVTGTLTASGDIISASQNGGPIAGLHNALINGNMGIYQRGTGAVTTTGAYGPADRWLTTTTGNTFSTTQGSFVSGDTLFDTGGAQYYTQCAVTSVAGAGNFTTFSQRIEDVRVLAGKTVTVSFWAKAAAGTPSIAVEVGQSFGAGGSADVTGTGLAQALTTSWAQYSKTFTLPNINAKTVGTEATHYTYLNFWLDSGATFNTRAASIGQVSKTVSIAQVQFEVSTVATTFERRPYGMELDLCIRYYQTVTDYTFAGYGTAANGAVITVALPSKMRITPTASKTGAPSLSNCTEGGSNGSVQGNGNYLIHAVVTGVGGFQMATGTQAFQFSAEL